jgi:hypothetical protein
MNPVFELPAWVPVMPMSLPGSMTLNYFKFGGLNYKIQEMALEVLFSSMDLCSFKLPNLFFEGLAI